MSPDTRIVALLLFAEVEVLDFAGPFEVFSLAAQEATPAAFRVVTVAKSRDALATVGGLMVVPAHDLASCPQADVVLVPGGAGSRRAMKDREILAWLARQAQGAEIVASICTGALLLGALGLLDGLRATTHWAAMDELRAVSARIDVQPGARFVDNGKYLTSAGISAGIDMSLYLVARLGGTALADLVVREMQYDWREKVAG